MRYFRICGIVFLASFAKGTVNSPSCSSFVQQLQLILNSWTHPLNFACCSMKMGHQLFHFIQIFNDISHIWASDCVVIVYSLWQMLNLTEISFGKATNYYVPSFCTSLNQTHNYEAVSLAGYIMSYNRKITLVWQPGRHITAAFMTISLQ